MGDPFNPLDKIHLAESIRDALLRQDAHQMPPSERFEGPGIYALYYTGDFPAYRLIAEHNRDGRFEAPIYVGEAVREGSRKGGTVNTESRTFKLHARIREHARSIEQSENLAVADFYFRYLVADDIWIPLGETLIIDTFAPIWNRIIDGFGIHTPGKGRKDQLTSAWDTLHPGRSFVRRVGLAPNPKTKDDLIRDVQTYLEKQRQSRPSMPLATQGTNSN